MVLRSAVARQERRVAVANKHRPSPDCPKKSGLRWVVLQLDMETAIRHATFLVTSTVDGTYSLTRSKWELSDHSPHLSVGS